MARRPGHGVQREREDRRLIASRTGQRHRALDRRRPQRLRPGPGHGRGECRANALVQRGLGEHRAARDHHVVDGTPRAASRTTSAASAGPPRRSRTGRSGSPSPRPRNDGGVPSPLGGDVRGALQSRAERGTSLTPKAAMSPWASASGARPGRARPTRPAPPRGPDPRRRPRRRATAPQPPTWTGAPSGAGPPPPSRSRRQGRRPCPAPRRERAIRRRPRARWERRAVPEVRPGSVRTGGGSRRRGRPPRAPRGARPPATPH